MEENQNPQANTPQEGSSAPEGAPQAPKRRPRIGESRFGNAATFDPQSRNSYQRGGANDYSGYGRNSYTRNGGYTRNAGGYTRGGYQRPSMDGEGYQRPQRDNEGGYPQQGGYQGYQRPQRPQGGYRRYPQEGEQGGYPSYQRPQRPNNNYQRYNDNQGYQQPQPEAPQEGKPQQEGQQPQEGFNQNYQPQGGYQQRGYQRPQQGGYGRQQGGYGRPQQGGYGRPQQGGYGRPQQGGYGRQQGGYGRPQQGGYGRPQQGGYGRPQQGGYGRPTKQKFNRKQAYNPHRPVEYTEAIVDPNEELRLNKYLANAGVCSRREADEHITAGLVKVNGEVVTELGTKVTRKDQVTFNDQPVSLERKVYVLLNKPKDTVTTSDDPQGRQTVMDLVRNASRERIYPVGRLDRNTTGVLLLTNDGDLASKLTHPKYIKKKIYHVWLDKDVAETDLARIAAGIELDDGPIHADAIAYANEEDKNQVGIEIHSGKNRIVRRIFEHLGYRVVKLDRVYFAGLTKKNLPRGRWRHLTQQEVSMLKMGAFE